MNTRFRHFFLLILLLLMLGAVQLPAAAQSPELHLSLSRDWGYGGFGGDIQGTFSFHARGPENLAAVEFYIDDTRVSRVETPPWKLRFVTDSYPLGKHTLYAIGYTSDGQTLKSNELVRNFVPAKNATTFIIKFVAPLLLLGLGIPLLLFWLDKKRNPTKYSKTYYGPLGGSVCPKCGCPFSRHGWAPNLLGKKLDRCPHCGKWSVVGRASKEELQAAALACGLESPPKQPEAVSEEDDLEKRLESSRYMDD